MTEVLLSLVVLDMLLLLLGFLGVDNWEMAARSKLVELNREVSNYIAGVELLSSVCSDVALMET